MLARPDDHDEPGPRALAPIHATAAAGHQALVALHGLQHLLVMFAGAVAVPLLLGAGLKLPPADIAGLVNASLVAAGLATLLQTLGAGPVFGARLPLVMGPAAAALAAMLSIAGDPTLGDTAARLQVLAGALIAAGLLGVLIAPVLGRLLPYLPPVVTGAIVLMIGIVALRTGIGWAAGDAMPSGATKADPAKLALAALAVAVILTAARARYALVRPFAVLFGLAAGCLLAGSVLGGLDLTKAAGASWFAAVPPLPYGAPRFVPVHVVTMSLAMLVIMVETAAITLVTADIARERIDRERLTRSLGVTGLAMAIAGLLGAVPATAAPQNAGLVSLSGATARWSAAAAGALLIVAGLSPKLGAYAAAIPLPVIAGAALVLFGLVAAAGLRILARADYVAGRFNLYVVAISIGFGLIPMVAPKLFDKTLALAAMDLRPLTDSGILLTALAAIVLNLYFNGTRAVGSART